VNRERDIELEGNEAVNPGSHLNIFLYLNQSQSQVHTTNVN
jgi:hypothetical protein